MTTVTCTIGGSPVELRTDSLQIDPVMNGSDVLAAVVVSLDGSYRPAPNEEIIVTQDSVDIFGGVIVTTKETGVVGPRTEIATAISAVSFKVLAEDYFVTETVADGTPLGTFLATLATNYFADLGITLWGSQPAGPNLPVMDFDDVPLSTVFSKLSEVTQYYWNINPSKVFAMRAIGTAAPFSVAVGSNIDGDLSVERSNSDYANRIVLIAGQPGIRDYTDSFTGDGVTTTFTLSFPIVGPFAPVASGAVGYGYVGVNAGTESLATDPSGFIWEYDPTGPTVQRLSGAPAMSAAITVGYHAQWPFRVEANDSAAQTADGYIKTRTYYDPDITSKAQAQARADELLAMALEQEVKIEWSTRTPGLVPGMGLTVNIPARNVNAAFIVQDITTTNDIGPSALRHRVTAVGGSLLRPAYWSALIRSWLGGDVSVSASVPEAAGSGGAAHPPEGAVQFNRRGVFGGSPTFTFPENTDTVVVGDDHDVSAVFTSDCGDTNSDLSEWDEVAPLMIAVAGACEDGTSGVRWNSADPTYAGASLLKIITATNRVRVRWAQFIPAGALPFSGFTHYIVAAFHYANGGSFTDSTKQLSLNSTVDGEFFFVRGNYNETTIAGPTAAVVFAENAWNHIEVDVTIHDTTGRVRLWHNDDLVLDADGLDTQDLGSALIDGVEIGQQRVAGATATLDNVDIDVARRNIVTGKGHEVHSSDGLIAGRNNVARGAVVEARGRDMTVDAESSIGINLTDTPRTLTTPNTHAIWADSFQVNGNEISAALNKRVFGWVFDGGGSVLTTGAKSGAAWRAPVAGTITKVTLLSDQDGAIVIDIWKDTLANYPPTNADSITASAPPTITSSNDSSEDATLTGWTTAFATGDIFLPNIDSVTSIERCTLLAEYEVT